MRLFLRRTCTSHPEQYDAYVGSVKVGYLRLRDGNFTVHELDAEGEIAEIIYEAETIGRDEFVKTERGQHLRAGAAALLDRLGFGDPLTTMIFRMEALGVLKR
jgi:hypothetical protein